MNTLSWKLEVNFNTQNHLFTNTINTDYKINTFVCNCGKNEFIISNFNDNINYICSNCENNIFYNANEAISNIEQFLYKFSYEEKIKDEYEWGIIDYKRCLQDDLKLDLSVFEEDNDINASYYFEVPYSIDFLSKKILKKKCSVLEYRINNKNEIYINLKIELSHNNKNKLINKLRDFIINNKNKLDTNNNNLQVNINISTIEFFQKYIYFKEYEFCLWENASRYHSKDITIKKALLKVPNRKESLIRKAIFNNYRSQIRLNKRYNHSLIELFCNQIKDPNQVIQAINLEIVYETFGSININNISKLFTFLQSYYTDIEIINLLDTIIKSNKLIFFIKLLNKFISLNNSDFFMFKKVNCNLKDLYNIFIKCSHFNYKYLLCEIINNYEVRLAFKKDTTKIWLKDLSIKINENFMSYLNINIYGFFIDNLLDFIVIKKDNQVIQTYGKYNSSLSDEQNNILTLWQRKVGNSKIDDIKICLYCQSKKIIHIDEYKEAIKNNKELLGEYYYILKCKKCEKIIYREFRASHPPFLCW